MRTLRRQPRTTTMRETIFVDGQWVVSHGSGSIMVVDPTTAEPMGSIPSGACDDVADAVAAAKRAFPRWSQVLPAARGEYLSSIADALERRSAELAELIALEVGMPEDQCLEEQVPVEIFRINAALASTFAFEERSLGSLILREAVGVVAAITPWNYPLSQIAAKVAPALAAGCTVVVKPSELAPLNAFVLAEIIEEVGLPPGVFNLVSGAGASVGEALVAHPDVDMVSFTGSTRAGSRIGSVAMERIARVTLELGGKSPLVVLEDADLQAAVTYGAKDCFANSGQTCSALTRILVPREVMAQAAAVAASVANAVVVGDPLVSGTHMGPVISASQRDRVRDYIGQGLAAGARLVAGGADVPEGVGFGYFVRPTVFADVSNDMAIAREEIFGPVLAIIPYDDEEDAVRIANDTDYGLWAAVWSADEDRARRVARRIRAGGVSLNGAEGSEWLPFGGYKQSGLGREFGPHGVAEFVEIKALVE